MIVGPLKPNLAKYGLQSFVPITQKLGLVTLATIDSAPSIASLVGIQHPFQQKAPKLMHTGADGALTGFQVHGLPLVAFFQ